MLPSSQPDVMPQMEIRAATVADAHAIAALSGELGYPTDVATMQRRLEDLLDRTDHAVLVACRDGAVIGWIHVAIVAHVQANPRAEIGGLVVASGARSSGVGAQLLARAEQWAMAHGLHSMVVRSQIMRDAAHRFYVREGYARTKTSAVFSKDLPT